MPPSLTLAIDRVEVMRGSGPQFEDDLNVYTLRRATVVDMLGSRQFTRKLKVFATIENVLDNDYDVGRTRF